MGTSAFFDAPAPLCNRLALLAAPKPREGRVEAPTGVIAVALG